MKDFDFKETLLNPIFKGNPISVLVLGICSSLAVTVQLQGACVMGLSVTIVTAFSSLIRHCPLQIRLYNLLSIQG